MYSPSYWAVVSAGAMWSSLCHSQATVPSGRISWIQPSTTFSDAP